MTIPIHNTDRLYRVTLDVCAYCLAGDDRHAICLSPGCAFYAETSPVCGLDPITATNPPGSSYGTDGGRPDGG